MFCKAIASAHIHTYIHASVYNYLHKVVLYNYYIVIRNQGLYLVRCINKFYAHTNAIQL